MPTVGDVINLLLLPPGDLYYHLTLLFTLQILLAVAWGYRVRTRRAPGAQQLWMAAVGMLLTRVALIAGSAAAGAGVLSPAAILPPLERFLDLVLVLFVVWGLLPVLRDHPRLGMAVLASGLLTAGLTYVTFAVAWPSAEAARITYNAYEQAQVWEIAGVSLAALALLALLIWSRAGAGLLAAALLAWLGGHLFQLLAPPFSPHLAGAVRLANLIGVPLATAVAFREVLRTGTLAPSASDPLPSGMPALGELARRVEQATDIETALNAALPLVSSYVGTEMAAAGLLAAAGHVSSVRIAGIYPRMPGVSDEPLTLSLGLYSPLDIAVRSRRSQLISEFTSDSELSLLLERSGFPQAGPLLVEPLISGDDVLGVLLAGNPMSGSALSEEQVQAARAAALVLDIALSGVNARQSAEQRAEQLATALRQRETEQDEHTAGLQAKLEQTRREAQEFARRAAELEEEIARQQKRGEGLARLLRAQEEQAEKATVTSAQITIYEEELRELVKARETLQEELEEWKHRAEELEQERARLEESPPTASVEEAVGEVTAESVVSGTLVADERGNIVLADRGAQFLLGYSESDLMGMPLHAAFADPFWTQAVEELLSGRVRNGMTSTVVFEQEGRLGRAKLAHLSTGSAGPSGYIAILQAEQGQEDQAEVVASLTNELRTPMTSIVGYTDLLLSESVGILGEMQRKFLQRVKANIERMGSLLNDVIEITAVDTGRIELRPEPVDLISVVEEAIMGLSTRFRERDLTVRLNLALELPPVRADRDALYQIMLHLLSNACQCSRQGTEVIVSGHLEEAEEEGLPPYLRISVTDTGGGIAPKDHPRVFQRFYRADRPLIAGLGETGVGMAISRTLVEAQGGRIWVESEAGAGSSFSFILPVGGPSRAEEKR